MLFFKECKKILFSLTFLIYIAALGIFYFTQFSADCQEQISPPKAGMEDYGYIEKEVPEILMPNAAESIVSEYLRGYYAAYPMGFYKDVKLSSSKKAQMTEIITEITGMTQQELDNFEYEENSVQINESGDYEDEGHISVYNEHDMPTVNIQSSMTYEHFRELMKKADKIIGGGSKYSDNYIIENFSRVPKTYEEAITEYEDFLKKDRVTGAYARLFCDYMGIIVSVLPVFVAVSLAAKDKRSHMEQLIYSRKISSLKLIVVRYGAIITLLTLPVLILSVIATVNLAGIYLGNEIDPLAISKLALGWLLPNIMISSSLGMMLTEIISPLIAIFVQGIWWIAGTMGASGKLVGNIDKFTLVCRHNSLGSGNMFADDFGDFVFNRVFFAALAILFILLTSYIYSLKRKGNLNANWKNSLRKFKA